jgi:membrane protein required for colicin V production
MEQLGITVFDVAVIAVAVFGAALGMSAGFAHAVLFIFSWIASGWVALKFHHVIQPEVQNALNSPELATFVSMLVVFVGALVVLVMLTNALSRSIRFSPLRTPDRILGAGFGVLCTWVVLGFAFVLFKYLGPRDLPPPVRNGATLGAIEQMASFVEPHIPAGVRSRLQRPGQDLIPPGVIPTLPTLPPVTPPQQ